MPDLLAPGTAPALVLLALRVGGLLLVAPLFSARTVPVKVRTGLLLLLTLVLAPAAVAGARAGAAPAGGSAAALAVTPATFCSETLVGLAIGLGAALLVAAVETAGDLMATTVGLSGATLLDPLGGQSSTVLTHFAGLFALTVLLALDGHLVMLDALGASVREVPLGSAVDAAAGLRAMVDAGGTLFVLGLRFAAPVLAATLIGNAALAVLTRAAPQINVLSVAFPVQIALGLAAMAAALAFVATWMTGWGAALDAQLGRTFHALLAR
jgi:flagellar biosynthetic protein FliR